MLPPPPALLLLINKDELPLKRMDQMSEGVRTTEMIDKFSSLEMKMHHPHHDTNKKDYIQLLSLHISK